MTVRRGTLCWLALGWLALSVSPLDAQPQITSLEMGFPAESGRRVRPGSWTPIYVDVDADSQASTAGEYELVTETLDSDDVAAQFSTPLPALQAGEKRRVLTYYRPGNQTARLTMMLRDARGTLLSTTEKAPGFGETLKPDEVNYLTLGARLPGLVQMLTSPRQESASVSEEIAPQRGVATHLERITDLPDRWFGYAGVDVVVLATSSQSLISSLLEPAHRARLEALAGWVKRGGRLIVSAGSAGPMVPALARGLGVAGLECLSVGACPSLPEMQEWVKAVREPFPGEQAVDLARFRLPAVTALVLVREKVDGASWPVLTEMPIGAGRIMLTAFDLDSAALAAWKGQASFWNALHAEMAPRLASRGRGNTDTAEKEELASVLQRGLENFEQIRVVSFGWVAFFLFLYILIVGPLDYLFLKKVVKRLELTWVTFPFIVIVISVAAYYSASAMKGDDLRINKIDVVDIDLASQQIAGTTWFSVFSPRVEAYTLGIESVPEWGGSASAALITPLNPPDGSAGGVDRPASQRLFRRPYRFGPEGLGLQDVPIPIWSSRSFTASWRASFSDMPPIEVQNFGLSRDGQRLTGRILNRLPVELEEVSLFYQGNRFALDNLPAGAFYRIDPREINLSSSGSTAIPWMNDELGRPNRKSSEIVPPEMLLKPILFHDLEAGPFANRDNSGLRPLDMGWRLRGTRVVAPVTARGFLDEVLIVGQAQLPVGRAEEISQDGVTPARVWLGRLPGQGERPALTGYLKQHTVVRITIPLSPVTRGKQP